MCGHLMSVQALCPRIMLKMWDISRACALGYATAPRGSLGRYRTRRSGSMARRAGVTWSAAASADMASRTHSRCLGGTDGPAGRLTHGIGIQKQDRTFQAVTETGGPMKDVRTSPFRKGSRIRLQWDQTSHPVPSVLKQKDWTSLRRHHKVVEGSVDFLSVRLLTSVWQPTRGPCSWLRRQVRLPLAPRRGATYQPRAKPWVASPRKSCPERARHRARSSEWTTLSGWVCSSSDPGRCPGLLCMNPFGVSSAFSGVR